MSKIFEATVVSAKMQKTIVVRVDRTFRHPRYRKVLTKHKTFKVHCEDATVKPGDFIVIEETRPISKDKHFKFVKKIKAGSAKVVEVFKDEVQPEKPEKKPQAAVKTEEVKAEVKTAPAKKPAKVAKKKTS